MQFADHHNPNCSRHFTLKGTFMSSNLIYHRSITQNLLETIATDHTMADRTPYCYHICWSKLNIHYYGRRTAKGCHPNEFWKKYFTSSDSVIEMRKKYGNPDLLEIRKIFNSIEKCCKWEHTVLTRLTTLHNENWLNRASNGKFDTTGMVVAKDISGSKFLIKVDDERLKNGTLVHINKGMVTVEDTTGFRFRIHKDDPRIILGELTMFSKNTVTARDSFGNYHRVYINDQRLQTNEFVPVNQGKIGVFDKEGKSRKVLPDDPGLSDGTYTINTTTKWYRAKHKEEHPELYETEKITIDGVTDTLTNFAKMHSMHRATLKDRINRGEPLTENIFRKSEKKTLTFNGITKTHSEWGRLYGVPPSMIWYRVERGEPIDEHIFRQVRTPNKLTINGVTDTINGFAKRNGISRTLLKSRIDKGEPLTENIFRKSDVGSLTLNGVTKVYSAWEKEFNLPKETIYVRIRRGEPLDEQIIRPPKVRRK